MTPVDSIILLKFVIVLISDLINSSTMISKKHYDLKYFSDFVNASDYHLR